MSKYIFILAVLIASVILTSCSNNNTNQNVHPPNEIEGNMLIVLDNLTFGDCCERYYTFKVIDSTKIWNQDWYWIALTNEEEKSIIASAQAVKLISDTITMEVSHILGLDSGKYYFVVYKCNEQTDEGQVDKAVDMARSEQAYTIDLSADSATTCLTECCTGEYFYAAAKRINTDSLIGISANIQYRFGKLCRDGFDYDPSHSHSCAYICIQGYDPSGSMHIDPEWVQTGYDHKRNNSMLDSLGIYSESENPISGWRYKWNEEYFIESGQDGDTVTFQLELVDTVFGIWEARLGGYAWDTFQSNYWSGRFGIAAQWTGEIFGWETDMPGREDAKCEFRDCKYKYLGNSDYEWAYFNEYDSSQWKLGSDDQDEWGIEIKGTNTGFDIWDKRLQP